MKKGFSLILAAALILSFSLPLSVCAVNQVEDNENENYLQSGQINLESVADKLYVKDGTVKMSTEDNYTGKKLMEEMQISPNLESVVTEMIENGLTPVGIGYTIVDLKEVTDANGVSHLEPMTKSDKMQLLRGSGSVESKGNLRLYVAASKTGDGTWRAVTTSQWTTNFQFSAANKPADGNDLMSVTAPRTFQFSSSYFTSQTSGFYSSIPSNNYYRTGLDYTSVVYSFLEFVNGQYATKQAAVWMNCTGEVSANNNMFMGNYCHTWGSAVPTFSVYPAGVAFTPTSNSWSIPCQYFY